MRGTSVAFLSDLYISSKTFLPTLAIFSSVKTFVKQKTNLGKQCLHGQYYLPAHKYYYEALLCSEDLEIYLQFVANEYIEDETTTT